MVLQHTMASPHRVQFLHIPLELRQRIYRLLFVAQPVLIDAELKATKSTANQRVVHVSSFPTTSPRSAQTLRLCCRIFREARPIFVAQTECIVSRYARFWHVLPSGDAKPELSTFLHITHLHINICDWVGLPTESWLNRLKALQCLSISMRSPSQGNSTEPVFGSPYKIAYSAVRSSMIDIFAGSEMKQLLDESIEDRDIRFVMYKKAEPRARTKVWNSRRRWIKPDRDSHTGEVLPLET